MLIATWYDSNMVPDQPHGSYEMAYAVHTHTCTYLLDGDGVCRWVVSQMGTVPAHVRQCIGAQFVACLDFAVAGALTPELRIGARALFVRHDGDRMVMLRTGAIEHVDDRRQEGDAVDQAEQPPPAAAVRTAPYVQYGKLRGVPHMARPPPRIGTVKHSGEEATITVNVPGHHLDTGVTTRRRRR